MQKNLCQVENDFFTASHAKVEELGQYFLSVLKKIPACISCRTSSVVAQAPTLSSVDKKFGVTLKFVAVAVVHLINQLFISIHHFNGRPVFSKQSSVTVTHCVSYASLAV